jgi:hypothetical protein
MGDRLRKVMSISNKIKYRRSLKSRVKLRLQIVISSFIMRMWNKYLGKVLIGLILMSYGVTGTVIFILLSAKSEVVIINNAEAKEVSGNARELNQKDNAVSQDIAPMPSKVDDDSVASLIRKYDWDVKVATAIMKAESQGDCTRIGDKHLAFWKDGITYGQSYGCMQVRFLEGRPEPEELLNPEKNIAYAYEIYQRHGWKAWSTYNSGIYQKYLIN